MEDRKKKKCLRYDAFGNCIEYEHDINFIPYSFRSQHKAIKPKPSPTPKPPSPTPKPPSPTPPTPKPPSPTPPTPKPPSEKRKILKPANLNAFKNKPTHKNLTDEEVDNAKLARASRIYKDDGLEATEEYLKENDLDYDIDHELSDSEGLVLINKKTGNARVAYRGTDIKNFRDISTDAGLFVGVPSNRISQMNQARS